MSTIKYDLTGKRFGRISVLGIGQRPPHMKGTYSMWRCRCDCGHEKLIRGAYLRKGRIRTCGCMMDLKLTPTDPRRVGDLSYCYFSRVRAGAKSRNMDFEMSMTDMWNLFQSQGAKCAISGLPISLDPRGVRAKNWSQTASLDRIDSSKGYIKGNVQWVHKWINLMKLDHSHEEFVQLVCAIADYQRSKKIN